MGSLILMEVASTTCVTLQALSLRSGLPALELRARSLSLERSVIHLVLPLAGSTAMAAPCCESWTRTIVPSGCTEAGWVDSVLAIRSIPLEILSP